ncbi:hypothetical protein L1857_00600 [Amycolatopsis thermalba]|uniref:Secreted protein n=1 Tax=Amycolatopsis thermalba TaxID=944492 RepID=A0ABY4NMA2_9PSEU|nr:MULTISPECIES: hypothetical protein [Amycolatopsis]UQS21431.1 hypothetical protein L1857_00600 [Amycolatopsis thermalba]
MRRSVVRVLAGGVIAAAALGLGGGVASADEVPIWVVPGVDAGPLLDPTIGLPTTALAPVYGLLTELAG